jgi:hypothetical protein
MGQDRRAGVCRQIVDTYNKKEDEVLDVKELHVL